MNSSNIVKSTHRDWYSATKICCSIYWTNKTWRLDARTNFSESLLGPDHRHATNFSKASSTICKKSSHASPLHLRDKFQQVTMRRGAVRRDLLLSCKEAPKEAHVQLHQKKVNRIYSLRIDFSIFQVDNALKTFHSKFKRAFLRVRTKNLNSNFNQSDKQHSSLKSLVLET